MQKALTGDRRWSMFWLLAVTQFMIILDTTIVAIAMPRIQNDLGFSPSGISWVLDAYMLFFGGFVLLGGRFADLAGRRRVLMLGMALFVVGSVLSIVATQPWLLVAGRIVQGFGGGLASPAALGLVIQVLPDAPDRNKGLSIWGGIAGVAGPTGVLLGGLLSVVAWQLVFVINIPIGLAVIALSVRMLPPGEGYVRGGVDVVGAVTATAGLCLLVFSATRGAAEGWDTITTAWTLIAAVVLLAIFVLRQLRAANPLLPRSLFGIPTVVLGSVASGLLGMALYGSFVINTLDLQQARGYSPIISALLLIPLDICLFLGTVVAGRTMARFGPSTVLAAGLAVQACALAWWASVLDVSGNVGLVVVLPSCVASLGLGAAIVGVFVVGTSNTPPDLAGTASGLVVTANQIGGAIGIAALTTVAASRTGALGQSGSARQPEFIAAGHSTALWVAAAMAAVGALVGLLAKANPGASWRRVKDDDAVVAD